MLTACAWDRHRARRYGSYGASVEPGFDQLILPYLDRGMIYAIAHVRGGGEMGRYWYATLTMTLALTLPLTLILTLTLTLTLTPNSNPNPNPKPNRSACGGGVVGRRRRHGGGA